MQITVEDDGACRKTLRIEIPADEVGRVYEEVLAEFGRQATIKGFRQGKVPVSIVRTRFGKEIREEVQQQLIPKGYRAAVEQTKINPVAVVKVDHEDVRANEHFIVRVTCDVAPEFEVPDYIGMGVTSENRPVTEEDVDREIQGLLERFATFEDVEGRAVAADDLVQIDYKGLIDGEPVSAVAPEVEGLSEAEDFWLHAGEHAMIPEMGEALIGADVGAECTVEVTFPDDFASEALRGMQATYTMRIKRLREKILPPLDEERLKALGTESESALRDEVSKAVTDVRERMDERNMRNQLIGQLLASTEFELPESVVQEETRHTIYEMVSDISRRGATEEQIEERKADLFDAASRSAGDKVKIRFILARIAQAEEIEAEPAEIEARLVALAQQAGQSPDEYRAELQKQDQLSNLALDIRFEKTLDFLLKKANVTESSAA